ncbi:MAG: hypothetical protein V4671_16985 [Armatimonadota bacterium]
MPGILISVVLMLAIAAGIVWPMIQRQRAVQMDSENVSPIAPAAQEHRITEQLCPHCSTMNASSRTTCRECGTTMPLESLSGLLGADKPETMRELTQAGLLLAGMIVVMLVSNWLPMPGKIAVIMGTLALLSFRLYKHVSGD